MTDILSPRERSERMKRVRGVGNRTTEMVLRSELRRAKVAGWRRHVTLAVITGSSQQVSEVRHVRPDFVFRHERVAVFVDGCFWHACPLHRTQPRSNRRYWRSKLLANRQRDGQITRALSRSGWTVVRIWEHDLKARAGFCVSRIRKALLRKVNPTHS